MNIKNIARFAALTLALFLGASAQGADTANLIPVEQGTHKLLRQNVVARVAVGDPNIADVSVINRRELLITGKALGITSLMVWSTKDGLPKEYRIRVSGVKDPLRTTVPDPELKGAVIDQGLALDGSLPNLLAHRRAKNTSVQGSKDGKVADRSSVQLETQVMTDVKIAEVSRRTLQQYGFNIYGFNSHGSLGVSPPGAQNGLSNSQLQTGTVPSAFTPVQNAFNILLGSSYYNITTMLSLLEQKGLARTLAEPSLMATSGQTASYLAGGEFPIPVAQGGSSSGSITVTYKEFGVRLNLTPTVLSRNRISLKVAPEVSDIDFSAGIQIGGVAVPSLIVRRTDTTVELGDGETFVISGLVSSNLVNNVNKLPWLGDIPVLGAFFKSTSINREDKELVMVVTPHLVRPLAREAKLPPLPGEKFNKYDPNFAQAFFLEHGNYDTGFSK